MISQQRNIGFLFGVYDVNNVLLGCAFFISVLKRHILLFNASNYQKHHTGAMTYLLSEYIQKNCDKDEVLDFEGSNLSGVQRFYKGFGAVEKNYIYIKKSFFNIKILDEDHT